MLQLSLQHDVPLQSRDQAFQVGDDDLRADALEPMDAAKKANRGSAGRCAAQCDRMHRQALRAVRYLADDRCVQSCPGGFDDATQLGQFRG